MTARFRCIWISDTHLGGKNIKSDRLYEFLRNTGSECLYLAGDVFDFHHFSRRWHWPAINTRIVRLILDKTKVGTKVFYLPGNHDGVLRDYCGANISNIMIREEVIHISADGRKYLVLHSDKFDCVIQNSPWLARLCGILYEGLLNFNRLYNRLRRLFGKEYHSISACLKHKCKNVVYYIGDFEEHLMMEIKTQGVDGIVCGHIHHASIKLMGKSLYNNSGDWVESCTALAENSNGTFGIIDWGEMHPLTESELQNTYEKDRCSD